MAARRLGADRRRSTVLGLALALFLVVGAVSTWPALREADEAFLGASGAPRAGGAVDPGDHLQSAYQLWLPGHQLARGEAPWRDPYSFQPLAGPRVTTGGWPLALVFGPLQALAGTVWAWNLLVLLSYAGAGLFAFAWLRALGLASLPALVGGLAFALAPYRVAQLALGHQLALVALLLPLALWSLERRRTWLAAAALASIPLSGQLHLALGAIPFVAAYAAIGPSNSLLQAPPPPALGPAYGTTPPRNSLLLGLQRAAAVALPALAAGVVVWALVVRGSLGAGGRSFAQVERYSAALGDLVARGAGDELETFVLLGWLTPLLALAGLVLLARVRPALAVVLGLGALLPVLLALGANLPGYETLWTHLPGLRDTRVPARLLPVAAVSLAGLATFALARVRRAAAVAALVLVALDLRLGVEPYAPARADPGNRVYAQRPPDEPLLELPVFLPDRHEGSVYQYYALDAPGPRLGGYSTVAPRAADGKLRALKPLECGEAVADPPRWLLVHRGLYRGRADCLRRLLAALPRLGYREVAAGGGLVLLRRRG